MIGTTCVIYQKRSPNPVLFHRGGRAAGSPSSPGFVAQTRGDGRGKRSREEDTYHTPQGSSLTREQGHIARSTSIPGQKNRTCSTQAWRSVSGPCVCVCYGPCVCVYVCMYVCIYIYVRMYVCMYVCMYVRIYVCVCVRLCICLHRAIHTQAHVCMRDMYVCVSVCVYVYTGPYIHRHMCVCAPV